MRSHFQTGRRAAPFAICLLFLSAALAAASQPGPQEAMLPFETIASDCCSGVREKQNVVVTGRKEWKKLWKKVHKVRSPRPPLPEIDFERNIVIGIFGGESGDYAHRVSVTKVVEVEDGLQVFTKEVNGNLLCPAPPATSQAYHIIAVGKATAREKNVEFIGPEQETVRCQ